jgi:hypothetical protein
MGDACRSGRLGRRLDEFSRSRGRRRGTQEEVRPMTDHVLTEMDEHLSREDRVLARLRRRAEDYARLPPEKPVMWSVIVIGLSAGAAMLAAGSVFARFFL